jgi:hypothetical protein
MTNTFDWKAALAALPAPPDPIGFQVKDPSVPTVPESRGMMRTRQIEELKEYRAKLRDLRTSLKGIEDVPEEDLLRLKKWDAQAAHALRQYEWREKNFVDPDDPERKGVAVTLHLRASEIAALDWIARRMYFAHPIKPEDEPTKLCPSRAQAVRDLIENYMNRRGAAAPLEDLIDTQEDWGAFWVREASWRRASIPNKMIGKVKPPSPPF